MHAQTTDRVPEAWQAVSEHFQVLLPGIPAFTNRGWLGFCTTVLFRLDGCWALYDTGHYSDRSQLLAALQAVRVKPADIGYVVLSHLHFDHILNLPLFPEALVIVSQQELNYARAVAAGVRQDPAIPETWLTLLNERALQVVDGAAALDENIEAVVVPGHTPGCLVLFGTVPVPVALCGDALKNGWELYHPGAATTAADEAERIKGIAVLKARAQVFFPGHDRPFGLRSGGLEYLSAYDFKITGNVFPRTRDAALLELDLSAGFKPVPPELA